MTTKAKGGRPTGKRNLTARDRIQRDVEKILDAAHKRALTGDPEAARLCLDIVGYFDLITEAVEPNGQS